jgi:hypothetical protein
MGMRRMLAVAGCTAAVVGVGAGSAFAGEITGNGKPTGAPDHANSICVFSGQNDFPEGSETEGPGGISQSYGQENRLGLLEPSADNPGKVGRGELTFHPGFACNGHIGFFSGGGEE